MNTLTIVLIAILATIFILSLIAMLIVSVKRGWLKKLYSFIINAIKDAESKLPSGHGSTKKEIAMAAVAVACKNLHIPYGLVKKLVSKAIDEIIEHYNAIFKK